MGYLEAEKALLHLPMLRLGGWMLPYCSFHVVKLCDRSSYLSSSFSATHNFTLEVIIIELIKVEGRVTTKITYARNLRLGCHHEFANVLRTAGQRITENDGRQNQRDHLVQKYVGLVVEHAFHNRHSFVVEASYFPVLGVVMGMSRKVSESKILIFDEISREASVDLRIW
jgi:hypothetical protein